MSRQSSASKIQLASYDDLFGDSGEQIRELRLDALEYFGKHPFRVNDDEAMDQLVESIRAFGVLTPVIVRPAGNGTYEIISGHRRHRACQILELMTIPAYIRDLDDDEAVIAMVDSNLQRESLLPSEKAHAYKMKMEALTHQGSRQLGERQEWSVTQISKTGNDSERQIHRYIRLTYLLPELLELVDKGKVKLTPAVNLSYLSADEQQTVLDILVPAKIKLSIDTTNMLKEASGDQERFGGAIDALFYHEEQDEGEETSDTPGKRKHSSSYQFVHALRPDLYEELAELTGLDVEIISDAVRQLKKKK